MRIKLDADEKTSDESRLVAELKDYIDEKKGFQSNGFWYFRSTWFNEDSLRRLKRMGIVKKAGTIYQLREQGVQFPEHVMYSGKQGVGMSFIYQVEERILNGNKFGGGTD